MSRKTHTRGILPFVTICGKKRLPESAYAYAPEGEWPSCKQCLKRMRKDFYGNDTAALENTIEDNLAILDTVDDTTDD